MKKKILLLTILSFFVCTGHGQAVICAINHNINYYPNGLSTATGIVQVTGRNTIEIFDEEQKMLASFIDVGPLEQYHQGDYIRIYYNPYTAIVVRIKRMTVLEYKENGQNLGNIYQKSSN